MKRAPPLELTATIYDPAPAKCRPYQHCPQQSTCLRHRAELPERAPIADFQLQQQHLGQCLAFRAIPLDPSRP